LAVIVVSPAPETSSVVLGDGKHCTRKNIDQLCTLRERLFCEGEVLKEMVHLVVGGENQVVGFA
jgi:hypothetical protein